MPIPFLLAGLGVAAGVLGAGAHMDAKETNEKAQRISEEARELYDDAKESLEQAQHETQEALLKLGNSKKRILDCSMKQFLDSYDKIKNVSIKESTGLKEISNFTFSQQDVIQLRKMKDISASLGVGAVAEAVFIGHELALAGSFLMGMGGLSTAFFSTLSLGSLAPVAAPAALVTGISASMKADENLEKANTMYAEAEAAAEKMKVSETLCGAISDRSEMFNDLLAELDSMFSECASLLNEVVRKKEEIIFKKKFTSDDFSENELKLVAVTRALAGAVKSAIDTPILTKEGTISDESQGLYDQTIEKLPNFGQAVETLKRFDYNL